MQTENEIPAGTPPATEIKVSVIVPVYNVEKYLRTCLDFIVAQTLRDIEIICVNDGSTDGSPAILAEYAAEDPRIRIIAQENRGLSAARNTGMNAARGKYLAFVDSDDWFYSLAALEELYERAEQFSLDLLRHRLICFNNATGTFFHRPWDNYAKFLPKGFNATAFPPEACTPFFWRIPVTAPGAFYRRAFIEKNKLRFAEGLTFEDQLFFRQCLISAARVGFIDKPYVVYRRNRAGSITDDWDGNWKDYPEIHRRLFVFAQEHLSSPKLLESLRANIVEIFSGAYAVRTDVSWKEAMAPLVRNALAVVAPAKYAADEEFRGRISPRSKLFLEWVYSGEGYAEFFRKRAGKFKRYAIMRRITIGKRRRHYRDKFFAKF